MTDNDREGDFGTDSEFEALGREAALSEAEKLKVMLDQHDERLMLKIASQIRSGRGEIGQAMKDAIRQALNDDGHQRQR